jgi:HEAT repeat protein
MNTGPDGDREISAQARSKLRAVDSVSDLRLEQALKAFDAARGLEARRTARGALTALGAEVLHSVLEVLSTPQPPDRFDALVELLVRISTLPELIEQGVNRIGTPDLRAATAVALGHAAGGEKRPEMEKPIRLALLSLAHDEHAGVRTVAVEALGLAGLQGALGELEHIATSDPNPTVRREAKTAVDELS